MTDRYNAFVIELDQDIREDDAERLLEVLRHLKGVTRVVPHVADWETHSARERVRHEIELKVHEAVRDAFKGEVAK